MGELKSRRISVALDKETCDKLQWLAQKELRTVSSITRRAICSYIRAAEAAMQKSSPPDAR